MIKLANDNYVDTLSDVQKLTYAKESMQVDLPQTKSEKVKIVGSNANFIIDLDGNVYEPLKKKEVKISLKLGGSELKEFVIPVEGEHTDNGINEQPTVIPSLSEWHGLEGTFTLNNDTSIVVLDNQFKNAAEIYIDDLKKLDIKLSYSDEKKNAIIFKYDNQNGLGEEGYAITVEDNQVIIHAENYTGAFYVTQSQRVIKIAKYRTDTSVII